MGKETAIGDPREKLFGEGNRIAGLKRGQTQVWLGS